MNQLAYPLQWPAGWQRTPLGSRKYGQFDGTLDRVRKSLIQEIDRLALGDQARIHTIRAYVVISTNMPLRKDGEPHAGASAPTDTGVAVYFNYKKKPVCFACDKYDAVWKNMRAIQLTIAALRGIERWGSSQLLDRAFTGFAALPERTGPSVWEILGVEPEATEADVMAAWREKVKTVHPDAPDGSHDAFIALNEAKDTALTTIRSRQ